MKLINSDEVNDYRKLEYSYIQNNGMDNAVAYSLAPDPIDLKWEIVTYYGKKIIDPLKTQNSPHYVYILTNPSIPGVCKIGFTTTTIYQRVKEINSATGVIVPWDPVFTYRCSNGSALERDIHEYLESMGLRVNDKREGFFVDVNIARDIIEQLGNNYKISD